MLKFDDARGRTADVRVDGTPGDVDDLRLRMSGAEAQNRVIATAAELAVTRQDVNRRALVRLTGLEPEVVDTCLHELCERGALESLPGSTDRFRFPDGRWPPTPVPTP